MRTLQLERPSSFVAIGNTQMETRTPISIEECLALWQDSKAKLMIYWLRALPLEFAIGKKVIKHYVNATNGLFSEVGVLFILIMG